MPFDADEVAPFHLDDGSVDHVPPMQRATAEHRTEPGYSAALRRELNERASRFAVGHALPFESTPAGSSSVLFAPHQTATGQPQHGNFFHPSYLAILAEPAWAMRLAKAHTGHRRARARADWRWSELDAAVSSDALLMNIFCCPGVLEGRQTRALLGVDGVAPLHFGYRARIPLANGRFDRTEIDLRLGHLLVEAKLTETCFQAARPALIHRYRDLALAFDPARVDRTAVPAYQLIRGVLAAVAEPVVPPASFCVLADARRPDLLEAWYSVVSKVEAPELRCRLQMLTWQELAATLPTLLQAFLEEKYGIVPAAPR